MRYIVVIVVVEPSDECVVSRRCASNIGGERRALVSISLGIARLIDARFVVFGHGARFITSHHDILSFGVVPSEYATVMTRHTYMWIFIYRIDARDGKGGADGSRCIESSREDIGRIARSLR